MITVRRKIEFKRRPDRTSAIVTAPPVPRIVPTGRVPRIARLMALAILFDRLIRAGQVSDQSELARLAHVTQPRLTQITNLNRLAPDIQEALLDLPRVTSGRERIHERNLRHISALADWSAQRRRWRRLLSSLG